MQGGSGLGLTSQAVKTPEQRIAEDIMSFQNELIGQPLPAPTAKKQTPEEEQDDEDIIAGV